MAKLWQNFVVAKLWQNFSGKAVAKLFCGKTVAKRFPFTLVLSFATVLPQGFCHSFATKRVLPHKFCHKISFATVLPQTVRGGKTGKKKNQGN